MANFLKALKLLKGYLEMYWLKPFDAINDTANAMAILQFDWSRRPILEIGGGDGAFSFIMHGGKFNFLNDRYDQVDITKPGDIYDFYQNSLSLQINRKPLIHYDVGVDLKLSHLLKGRETGLYLKDNLISAKPEKLPIKNNTFSAVFLYTFHGLTDYTDSLNEIARVIKRDGQLFMIAFNDIVKNNFICHKIQEYCAKRKWNFLSKYFSGLDGGRYQEIAEIFSNNINGWERLFNETGFQIQEVYTQISPLLWKIYDTQTRPFLKRLIRINWLLKKFHLKTAFKLIWLFLWFPILILFYLVFAMPSKIDMDGKPKGIFLCIMAKPA